MKLVFKNREFLLCGNFKEIIYTCRESSAVDIVKLHHLMFPKMTSAVECSKLNITGIPMIKVRATFGLLC